MSDDIAQVEKEPTVTLLAPEGASNVAHNGQEYTVDANGLIEVPASMLDVLACHGYTLPDQEADESVARHNKKKAR